MSTVTPFSTMYTLECDADQGWVWKYDYQGFRQMLRDSGQVDDADLDTACDISDRIARLYVAAVDETYSSRRSDETVDRTVERVERALANVRTEMYRISALETLQTGRSWMIQAGPVVFAE